MIPKEKEHGVQPLDEVLGRLGLRNDDLIRQSTLQLTHKQVQKARKGRRVTVNIQKKIVLALNACGQDEKFKVTNLFNY